MIGTVSSSPGPPGPPPRHCAPFREALNIHTALWYGGTPVVLFRPIRPLDGPPPSLLAPTAPPAFSVEGSLWPFLTAKLGRSATTEQFEQYLDARRTWLDRCEPHVCLVDVREVYLPPCQLRQRYAQWLREHEPALRRWCMGSVYVLKSPEVRMMMSLIRHASQLTTPFIVTETLSPGAAWAAERLQEAGLAQAATRVRAAYGIAAS